MEKHYGKVDQKTDMKSIMGNDIQRDIQKMIEDERKDELQSLQRKLAIVPGELKKLHTKRKKKNKISKKARRKNR